MQGFLRLCVVSHGLSGNDLPERLAGFALGWRRLSTLEGVVSDHLDLGFGYMTQRSALLFDPKSRWNRSRAVALSPLRGIARGLNGIAPARDCGLHTPIEPAVTRKEAALRPPLKSLMRSCY